MDDAIKMKKTMILWSLISIFILFILIITNHDSLNFIDANTNHHYSIGQQIDLWVSKIGPYRNPQEVYDYYTFPYCAPQTLQKSRWNELHYRAGGGPFFYVHRLRHSGHDVIFGSNDTIESCTTKELTAEQANQFSCAIRNRWFYQMYVDDLPVWGMVGELLPNRVKSRIVNTTYLLQVDSGEDIEFGYDDLVPYVYTTRTLKIKYNSDQIIQVDLTSDYTSLAKIESNNVYEFSLRIEWETTNKTFDYRFDRYIDHYFFNHEIHRYSLFNNIIIALILIGIVASILIRTLRKDLEDGTNTMGDISFDNNAKLTNAVVTANDQQTVGSRILKKDNTKITELEEGDKTLTNASNQRDEPERRSCLRTGIFRDKFSEAARWKTVYGDVFRPPRWLPLLASLLGTGWQLVVLTFGFLIITISGPLGSNIYTERSDKWFHSVIACYSVSSIAAGYQSSGFYTLYSFRTITSNASESDSSSPKTSSWQFVMLLTLLMFPVGTVSIVFLLNAVGIFYGTINTIPFFVICKLCFVWVFVSLPFCCIGTFLGRHTISSIHKGDRFDHFPCRVNPVPRPIPETMSWFRKPIFTVPMVGSCSFGCIFVELCCVLTSLWDYKYFQGYDFLLVGCAMLAIVVCMSSITVVYICLNSENYVWQWTAFSCGASTGLYVLFYAVWYYVFRTQMGGIIQFAFYFGYMSITSLGVGIFCGALSHGAASTFVYIIYNNLKVD